MIKNFITVDNGAVAAQPDTITHKILLVVCTEDGKTVTLSMDKEKAIYLTHDIELSVKLL